MHSGWFYDTNPIATDHFSEALGGLKVFISPVESWGPLINKETLELFGIFFSKNMKKMFGVEFALNCGTKVFHNVWNLFTRFSHC